MVNITSSRDPVPNHIEVKYTKANGLSIMADTIMLPKAVYLQKMAGNVSRQTEDSITSISRI